MLGHDESRVSVADIENRRNGGKKQLGFLLCDSPLLVTLDDGYLFSNPSAAHDTLLFYCTMLGHDEARVSVADIEN